jgi:hypothetical protein
MKNDWLIAIIKEFEVCGRPGELILNFDEKGNCGAFKETKYGRKPKEVEIKPKEAMK